jgi:regulator of extracellular matrix RemA (YlzA/DUF370 family)
LLGEVSGSGLAVDTAIVRSYTRVVSEKQTLAPGSNLILAGFGYYLACERIIAVMPVLNYGDIDPALHARVKWPATFTKRYLVAHKKKGGEILDFTRGRKVHSVIVMDNGTVVKSPYNAATLVDRVGDTKGYRSDKGKPRPAMRKKKEPEA